ncbi:MAG: hypothetical protein GEU83_09540 [Pseudonocardiaceae bacterium]|nr:hypothetical protein [Pseudonocardiaceae bacterium]
MGTGQADRAAARPPGRAPALRQPVPRTARTRWTVVAVAALIAPLAAQIPSLTWPATATTLAVGTGVVFVIARGWPARTAPSRPVTLRRAAPWFVLAAVFTALELATLIAGSQPTFPTVSSLLGPLFVDTGPRVIGWFVWLTTGYWLLQR